jgi:hypothetical protein
MHAVFRCMRMFPAVDVVPVVSIPAVDFVPVVITAPAVVMSLSRGDPKGTYLGCM